MIFFTKDPNLKQKEFFDRGGGGGVGGMWVAARVSGFFN